MGNKKVWNKKLIILSCMLVFTVLSSMFVYAWGIAFTGNQISLKKGESITYDLNVQNYAGDDDLNIALSLEGDSEIVTVLDEPEFLLTSKSSHVIPLKISIPADRAKKEYSIEAKFTASKQGNEGIAITTAKVIPLEVTVPDGDESIGSVSAEEIALDQEGGEQSRPAETNGAEKEKTSLQSKTPTGAAGAGIVVLPNPYSRVLRVVVALVVLVVGTSLIYSSYKKRKQDKWRF